MRALILALALLVLAGPSSFAEEPAADERAIRDAVQQVIRHQNAAFRRDDGETAFAFAAPGIQKRFGTPAVFMEMVRTAYPQVYAPQVTEFRDFYVFEGTPVQRVFYAGADGSTVIAHYAFEAHPDGSWRIMHVALLDAEEKAI